MQRPEPTELHQPKGWKPGWDVDYSLGHEGEELFERLGTEIISGAVEVKADFKSATTGNVFVEVENRGLSNRAWKPSGISTTTARSWVFVCGSWMCAVSVPVLKQLTDEALAAGCVGECRQDVPARGALIDADYVARVARRTPMASNTCSGSASIAAVTNPTMAVAA